MDDKNNIAKTIKQLRKEAGYTQKELAEATGISLSAIIAYENKQREPNSRNMAALEQFFHVSGAYLRGFENRKEREGSIAYDPADIAFMLRQLQEKLHDETAQNQQYFRQILEVLTHAEAIEDVPLRSLLLELLSRVMKEIANSMQPHQS